MSEYHKPVLLQQVCTFLDVLPGKKYIDATLGGGGHSLEIIRLGGLVLGLDQDPDALNACPDSEHLVKVKSNFIHLEEIAVENKWVPADGILYDLGVSSYQISTASRGFSFQQEGPLDMRMDPTLPITAEFLVNNLPLKDLTRILKIFGEEPQAQSISKRIIAARPLTTTTQLSAILGFPNIRRRVFQALRITINDELGALSEALPQSLSILAAGGRIAVISFHSLEDRIVKDQFSKWVNADIGRELTAGPIVPDAEEQYSNPRSKSAKLRVFQKNCV